MAEIKNITPKYELISSKEKVVVDPATFAESVGGMTAGATSLTQGSGDDSATINTKGIFLGSAIFETAPYRVDMQGNLHATSATISGDITALTGHVGGWVINATTLSAANIILDSANERITLGASNPIVIDGLNKRIQSDNYVSGVNGAGFLLSENLLEVGNAAIRGVIRSAVFQRDVVNVMGGNFAVLDGDVLSVNMTALDSSTLTIEGTTTLAAGDILRIKDSINDEWLEVVSIASAPTYTVNRDKAGMYASNNNPIWKKGATVVNYKQSGDGGIYMTASETNAPYLSIFDHAGSPWATINTRLRLGNLNGYLGYVTDLFGIAIGETTSFMKYDPTNGMRIMGDISATSGYFGDPTNGISIESTGLLINGSGYIRTDLTGTRLEINKDMGGGYTDGLILYDVNDLVLFRILGGGGYPCLSMNAPANASNASFYSSNTSNETENIYMTTQGGNNGLYINASGSNANRNGKACLYAFNDASYGHSAYFKNGDNSFGDITVFQPNLKNASVIRINKGSAGGGSWSDAKESRVTNMGFLQFPAYYHYSEFDELVPAGGGALSSSIIAKAYWTGGGTSGTQIFNDDSNGNYTELELSTTDTASRTSSIIFNRSIGNAHRELEFRIQVASNTNTRLTMGWTYNNEAEYIRFIFDTAKNASLIYAEVNDGTEVSESTGVSVATGSFHTFRIVQLSNTFVYFYIDDVLVKTISTHIPTRGMKPYFYIDNKAASELKRLYIDYVKIWMGRLDNPYHP